ncbi:MAG: hypothetical protein ABSF48_18660 [Thermodesulfobacteriota bacterium]
MIDGRVITEEYERRIVQSTKLLQSFDHPAELDVDVTYRIQDSFPEEQAVPRAYEEVFGLPLTTRRKTNGIIRGYKLGRVPSGPDAVTSIVGLGHQDIRQIRVEVAGYLVQGT